MAIKSICGPYIAEMDNPHGALNSNFFTPYTKIGAKPLSFTIGSQMGGEPGTIDMTRPKSDDPRVTLPYLASPSSTYVGDYTYVFTPTNPYFYGSVFYGDKIEIQTEYQGSIAHPVAPNLEGGNPWVFDNNKNKYIATINLTTNYSITWPRLQSAVGIAVTITGANKGSFTLNYKKNNHSESQNVYKGTTMIYVDPGSQYSLFISTSYKYSGRYNTGSDTIIGTADTDKEISINIYYDDHSVTPIFHTEIGVGGGGIIIEDPGHPGGSGGGSLP